jgi:hypothetical protein
LKKPGKIERRGTGARAQETHERPTATRKALRKESAVSDPRARTRTRVIWKIKVRYMV